MILRTNIEIVTGFLGCGKTTFINALLENTLVEDELVIIVQCEKGQNVIDKRFQMKKEVLIKKLDVTNLITSGFIEEIIKSNKPHRIIIEHNGSKKLQELIKIINERKLRHLCKVTDVFNIIDSVTFKVYIKNMGNLLMDGIYNSNLIVLTNIHKLLSSRISEIVNSLRRYNSEAYILKANNIKDISSVLIKENILFNGYVKKFNVLVRNFLRE
jgi:G3E family GTPase